MKEQYQPTQDEIKKAEENMNLRERERSSGRENLLSDVEISKKDGYVSQVELGRYHNIQDAVNKIPDGTYDINKHGHYEYTIILTENEATLFNIVGEKQKVLKREPEKNPIDMENINQLSDLDFYREFSKAKPKDKIYIAIKRFGENAQIWATDEYDGMTCRVGIKEDNDKKYGMSMHIIVPKDVFPKCKTIGDLKEYFGF